MYYNKLAVPCIWKNRKILYTHLRTDINPAGMKALDFAKRTPIATSSASDTANYERRHE
jgi:hypothetical protein